MVKKLKNSGGENLCQLSINWMSRNEFQLVFNGCFLGFCRVIFHSIQWNGHVAYIYDLFYHISNQYLTQDLPFN